MRVTGQYLLDHGVGASPGHEIDPVKEYWYESSTGTAYELPSLRQRWWSHIPWVRRRDRQRWQAAERERRAIMTWEFEKLPEDFTSRTGRPNSPWPRMTFGQCLQIVTGRDLFPDDSLSLEMAADTICALLAESPTAEKAFREWFVTRYPFYA